MKSKKEGEKLFYTDCGKGETLCLLHGFLENQSMWRSMIPDLEKQYRVLAVDLPGHGASSLLKNSNRMLDMAYALDEVFTALKISRVKLVGHSMGGYVALAYAKTFPEKVDGILLLNSTPYADSDARRELREHGVDMAQRNYRALVSMSVTNLFSKELRANLEEEIEAVKQEALKTSAEAYIACQKSMAMRTDYSDFLKKADFKKLILLGREDTLINYEQLYADYKDSDVKIDVLPGGHMLHIENFSGVLAHLLVF